MKLAAILVVEQTLHGKQAVDQIDEFGTQIER